MNEDKEYKKRPRTKNKQKGEGGKKIDRNKFRK
jgi:hypothetical protein